jgi:antitoxin (DNA-binding transcriptional repressor) of toxin-antitoxin stability system
VHVTVNVEQAQSSLKELIRRTAEGETVVITQGDKPVAELRAVAGAAPAATFGACKGMLKIVADDEEHLKDFPGFGK